ncbi:MAG: hypothetical protein IJU51_01365 [Clostridia bacterium]|nr:hypothetical protein [Clostridia bacterium]
MKIRKGLKYLLVHVMASLVLISGTAMVNAEPGDTSEFPPAEQSETDDPGTVTSGTEEPIDIPFDPEPSQVSEPSQTEEPDPEPVSQPDPEPEPEPSEPSVVVYPAEPSVPDYHQESQISSYIPEPSHIYIYDDNNDHYEYSYVNQYETTEPEYDEYSDVYEEVSEEPERDTSSLDISDYELSDTMVLTPQDWEQLKKENQGETSTFELKPSPASTKTTDAFKKLKEESKGGNDDWIFLVWGIALLSVGVIAIGAVIVTTVISKKKRRK